MPVVCAVLMEQSCPVGKALERSLDLFRGLSKGGSVFIVLPLADNLVQAGGENLRKIWNKVALTP